MSSTGLETIVAGVRCRDVLAELSEFIDGSLLPARVKELQAHLAGCDNCARFGGHIAQTLTTLRSGTSGDTRDHATAVLARIGAER